MGGNGLSEAGSISLTVRSVEFATHTRSAPKATDDGPLPTGIESTGAPLPPFAFGSIFETLPPRPFVTQTNPAPTATPVGEFGYSSSNRFAPRYSSGGSSPRPILRRQRAHQARYRPNSSPASGRSRRR